jgi:hypothetical protein
VNQPDLFRAWVVYENPKDYPGHFVVRMHVVLPDGSMRAEAVPRAVEKSLYEARMKSVPGWAVRIDRESSDDPVIVETWI